MNLRKITVVFLATAMVSIGFGISFSDNVQAAFVDTLSGNGLGANFIPYNIEWNDAGTMAVVVGFDTTAIIGGPNAYAYWPDNDTYFPLTDYYGTQTLYGVEYSSERVIPTPSVLLVDADWNEDGIAGVYYNALLTCNADITYWDVWNFGAVMDDKPLLSTMISYDVVIWVPTRDMNGWNGPGDALSSADEVVISQYLGAGGNFMLANIYYTDYTDIGSGSYAPGDFAFDYLGMSHINNKWSMYDDYVNETVGDAVYGGVGSCWLDWGSAVTPNYGWTGSPDFNDEIFPGNGEICFFGTDSAWTFWYPMGIRYDGDPFKSVFFGFPIEVISSDVQREDIMEKTLEWFMPGSQGPTQQSTVLIVDADYYEDGLADAYNWSLTNNSWDVTIWDVYPDDIKPTTADMIGYDLVIWVPTRDMQGPGGGGEAFDSLDEGQVSGYLGTGGNFFLSNIHWSQWSSGGGAYINGDFAYDVFSISGMNSQWSSCEDYVQGWGGDEVFSGFGPAWYDWNRFNWGGFNPGASDEINPWSAISSLEIVQDIPYTSYTGGVRYDGGTFKSMFMGFPFEVLLPVDADEFWARALEWFVPGSTAWDPSTFTYQDVWWVCGDDASVGWNTAYRVVPSEGLTLQNVGTANVFQDVACDHLGNPLFVSLGRSDMQYYDVEATMWYSVGGSFMIDYDFYGVDFNENDRRFYAAGENTADNLNVIWYTDNAPLNGGLANAYSFNYAPAYWIVLREIAWNLDLDYGLAVGDNLIYKVWPYGEYGNGTMRYNVINTTFGTARDVSWDTDGWNEAGIVGSDGSNARYWRYYDSNPQLIDGYFQSPPVSYYTCAMKPPSSPKWLMIPAAGGGIRINILEKDESAVITLNADQPHIFTVDMWKQNDVTRASVLNTQVDADTTYTFFIEGNYTIGGTDHWNDLEIDITAWYDDGNMFSTSAPGDPTWALDDFRTRQFNVSYNVGAGTVDIDPTPLGAPEFDIASNWQDPNNYGLDGKNYRLYFNITFGAQTCVADGTGFGAGAATRTWDNNFAFNDAFSWDLRVTAYNPLAPATRNVSYEEFGINEYASVSVVGSPGGSAPPGVTDFALTTPSQIYYSSNSPYYVNVSIPHLYKDGNPASLNWIPATDVKVHNTHSGATTTNSDISLQIAFMGPNVDLCIWGKNPGILISPTNHGTQMAGPDYSDYTADSMSLPFEVTEVYWWVTVPAGLPEGVYRGTITVTLWH